ncbi:hypothetical protein EDI_014230 [Entamoeba dispar SAW760]|uniref:Nuclear pore protein n=1 Tax=Entamoeba dispar (strain ATCC PRA-260 / SAW760) TaxID=370354 RepID=B0EHH7_ENTDS|nr:uncharacterized protein EDI_014230 [Entamoeba dispar SAW760]EDR26043.1 hypothetical protein EDI_014230 [Entamoeba dispar SAW760]|eukprot:EDR26043.1 hypothetical protein EDI_014230 [Entamoeba dispar SAW760]
MEAPIDVQKMLDEMKLLERNIQMDIEPVTQKPLFIIKPEESTNICVQTIDNIIQTTLFAADRLFLRERKVIHIGPSIETQGLQTVAQLLCENDPIEQLRSIFPPSRSIKVIFDLIQDLYKFRIDNNIIQLSSAQAATLCLKYVELNFKDNFVIQNDGTYKKDDIVQFLSQTLEIENGRKPTTLTIAFHLYRAGLIDEAIQTLEDEMGKTNEAFSEAIKGNINKLKQLILSDPIEKLFGSIFTKKDVIGIDPTVDAFIHANVDNYIWYKLSSSQDITKTFNELQQIVPPVLLRNPDDTTFFFLLLLQQYEQAVSTQIERGTPFDVIGYTVLVLLRKINFLDERFVLHYLHSILLSVTGCYQLLDSINDKDAAIVLSDVIEKPEAEEPLLQYARSRPQMAQILAPLVRSKLLYAHLMIIAGQKQMAHVAIQELIDSCLMNGESIDELIQVNNLIEPTDEYFQNVYDILHTNDCKEVVNKAIQYQFIPSRDDFSELQNIVNKWDITNEHNSIKTGTRIFVLSFIFRNIIQSISTNSFDSSQYKLVGKYFVAMVALLKDCVDDAFMELISGYKSYLLN